MTDDPDQIRDSIEQTQRDLSADVDALTGRLSPQRIMHDQVQRARTVMGSMKERVAGAAAKTASAADGTAGSAVSSAQGAVSSAQGAVSSAKGTVTAATSSAARTAGTVATTVRRGILANPIAACLLAFGAGWLIAALLPSPGRTGGRRN